MRKELKSTWTAAAAAIYFAIALNITFWRFVLPRLSFSSTGQILFALSMPLVLFLVFYMIFIILVWPYVGKFLLGLLLIGSSAASYFMYRLNVIIDSEMIRNVFEAKPHEVFEMVTLGGIGWVLVFGVVPTFVILFLKIRYRSWVGELAVRCLHMGGSLAILIVLAFFFYKDYASASRNNKMAGRLLNPFNYITSTRSYFRKQARKNSPFVVIDSDPVHVPYEDPNFTVLVIMIGETARAMNFSLNGYERETNPKLSRQDIVNFPNVKASGTATAFSLPCMFSHLPREKFDIDSSYRSENLLDVMAKAGYDVGSCSRSGVWAFYHYCFQYVTDNKHLIGSMSHDVLWIDNDGGSKGVSDRVPTIDLMRDGNPEYRNGDTFFDEVLLDGLEERIAGIARDTVVVLHMMGSHGPSYYRRYPDAFRVFVPTADTAEIQSRPREEIVNAYDNTILYTDYVVSEVIDILKRFPQHEAGLIFVSDHGESLGENGLYLHGIPYYLAPEEQVRVPMVLWMSDTMRREDHVDYERLKAAARDLDLSHDYLFHSVLGLVEIDTDLYDEKLDLFKQFRTEKLRTRSRKEM